MAKELSQEEVLDFLCQGGGKVPNASLVAHFKHFLRDPQVAGDQLLKRRDRFKRYVNSVAVVKQEGAVKYVVLRSRYRDLLGEELSPAIPGHHETAISNNREDEETGSQVIGGGWSRQEERYPRGEPAFTDHQRGAPMTYNDPDLKANLTSDGKIRHGQSYTEPEMRLPSSQPLSSSSGDQQPTAPLSKTSSSVNNAYLPSIDTFPHDNIQLLPFSRTFSQQSSDASLSIMKTTSSPPDTYMTSTKNFSSSADTSIPSTNTSSSQGNTFIPFTKNSSPSSTSIPSTNTSAPGNTFIPSSNTSSPCNTPIPFTKISSPSETSLSTTKTTSSPPDTYTSSTKNSSSPADTSIVFIKISSSPGNTFIPSTNTSSPANTPISFTKNSSSPSNVSTASIRTYSSPSDTYIPSTRTSSPTSDTSIPSTKTSSPSSDTSIPFNKTTSPPINAPTRTSEPLSSTASHYNKDYYPAENLSAPYSKTSSFCSLAQPPSLPQSPSPGTSEHWRPLSVGVHRTETTNPVLVNASCRGQQEQRLGCTEIGTPNFEMNGTFPQGVHSEQLDNPKYINEQQRHGFYEDLAASPSRYMNSTHPSSSLLLPLESSMAPLNVQLEEYEAASPCPSPPLLLNDMRDLWMCQMPVFKSIRCQLSLQDMEDFVDQESCGSEGSDSGEGGDCDTEHKDDEDFSSDSNTEKYTQYIEHKCENTKRCPPNRKFLSIIEQYSKLQSGDLLGAKDTLVDCELEPNIPAENKKSPYVAKSFLTDQAPILFELARHPPKHRASSRFRDLMSSSDDELIDRDLSRRRRPSRTKRPPDIVVVPPQPDVDLLLLTKPVSNYKLTVKLADQKEHQSQYGPKANEDFLLKKSFNYKSSTVPLDPAEHDWIVKSASGSWLQVYGLFNQDPQLALRKDFISGNTVLHWFAKHGAIDMFHKFVVGARKAGVEIDFNIKSNGGYTPLHIAAIHGHQNVAAMLVEKLRANVKLRDNSGKRAWQYLSCNTSGEVWRLLGAPKGKTIFASRTLNTTYINTQNKSSQINRKTSLAAFLKPQHQKWKANNHPVLREREIYSD
ncbi:ankyrin repeat domain-containing protein SOWAHB [Aquarana catesbeiana]|uniref:ankyrin repeat domain-containing protein SOWAHB n=1 Tax=Aquarana catesbeiana TaxID=8400 RepID=UPI003CC99416